MHIVASKQDQTHRVLTSAASRHRDLLALHSVQGRHIPHHAACPSACAARVQPCELWVTPFLFLAATFLFVAATIRFLTNMTFC